MEEEDLGTDRRPEASKHRAEDRVSHQPEDTGDCRSAGRDGCLISTKLKVANRLIDVRRSDFCQLLAKLAVLSFHLFGLLD